MRTALEKPRWIDGRALGVVLAVLFATLAGQASGTTYYADADFGDNAYDGLSNQVVNGHGPKRTAVNAMATASSGDLLVMAEGSYGQEYWWNPGNKDLTLKPQNEVIVGNVDLGAADTDGDGIPDWWMLNYFDTIVATGGTACVTCDPDGDEVANSNEYATATNPLESDSYPPIVATPTFSVDGGTFATVQDVTVDCAVVEATIRYTVNGQAPTTNSLAVASGDAVRVAGSNMTLKAKAWVNNMTPSAVKSATFTTPFLWPYTNAVTIFVTPGTNHCVFYVGDTVSISNSLFTSYEVYNLRATQVVFVANGAPTNLVNLAAGHYFIESTNDIKEFAVLSTNSRGVVIAGAETPAGMFNHSWEIYHRFKPQMWRGIFTSWRQCEPSDGVYSWTNAIDAHNLDLQIDAALAAGATKVIIPAAVRPQWMEGANNDAAFVSKYTAFCSALAQHLQDSYSNRVDLGIEVWNEPHYSGVADDPEALPFVTNCQPATVMSSYFVVLTNAYKAIKAVSTNIEVVAAGFTLPPMDMYYPDFVAMGGTNYMDALGVTYKRWTAYESSAVITDACYCCGGSVDYFWPEDDFDTLCRKWISDIGGKRLYMYEGALLGHSSLQIPYYYSGVGAKADNGISSWQGYTRAQKQVVMGRAAGVSMLLNHVWEGFPSGEPTRPTTFAWEFAGWEYDPAGLAGGRGPSPKTSAWLSALAQINGGTSFTNLHDSIRWVYAWYNPSNTTVAAWMSEGATATNVSFAVTDVYGNTLASIVGEEPVYWTTNAPPYDAAMAGFVAIGGTP